MGGRSGAALVAFVCLLFLGLSSAKEIPIKYTKYVNCTFAGYRAAGSVKRAGEINSTMASFAENRLKAVLGVDQKATSFPDNFFSNVGDVAPYLGPALGQFGSVGDIIMSRLKPKQQDILDGANAAWDKLNRDTIEKIDAMGEYLDANSARDLKNLITKQMQGSFDLWVGCIDETNIVDANECQRDAYADAKSLKSDFALFGGDLLAAKHLSGSQVRELEAYMVPLRNYVDLQIMILKTLIEVYANESGTEDGLKYNRRFKRHLRELVDYYTAYENLAVQEIMNYWEGNTPDDRPCSSESDITCVDDKEDVAGLVESMKAVNHYKCSCKIDDVSQLCQLHLQVPTENNFNKSEYKVFVGEESDIVKNYGSKLLRRLRAAYEKESSPVVREYFDVEVLAFKKVWRQARDYATGSESVNENKDEKIEEGAGYKDENRKEDYSSRYQQRKAKAEFVTTTNNFLKEHDDSDRP